MGAAKPSETNRPDRASASTDAADIGSPRNAAQRAAEAEAQSTRLNPEEIERLEDYEDLEDFIEETPEGPLSIISDEDIPGAPG